MAQSISPDTNGVPHTHQTHDTLTDHPPLRENDATFGIPRGTQYFIPPAPESEASEPEQGLGEDEKERAFIGTAAFASWFNRNPETAYGRIFQMYHRLDEARKRIKKDNREIQWLRIMVGHFRDETIGLVADLQAARRERNQALIDREKVSNSTSNLPILDAGTMASFKCWRQQVETELTDKTDDYPTPYHRIVYVANRCTGEALKFISPRLRAGSYTDVQDLFEDLGEYFDPSPGSQESKERSL